LICTCAWMGTSRLAAGTELRLTILDSATEKPVPCRIHLKDATGKPVQPKNQPFWHDHFVCAGFAELDLAPGAYFFEAGRGPEYLVRTGGASIAEGKTLELTNRLQRMVDLSKEGWWSGELHVHRPLADIELLMRAEDLHIAPVITWW